MDKYMVGEMAYNTGAEDALKEVAKYLNSVDGGLTFKITKYDLNKVFAQFNITESEIFERSKRSENE